MDFLGKNCPVCSEKFQQGDDIVVCPKCGAPYHRECYKEKGKCIYPNLHKENKSWKEVYCQDEPKNENDGSDDDAVIICPFCGTKNEKDNGVCKNCGSYIPLAGNPYNDPEHNNFDEQYGNIPNEFKDANNVSPFSIFIDPMGGVSEDEDFNGVTGAELSKFVKVNTPYYMQIFKKIKSIGKSRFNFMAFFFSGGWFLYRKQYLKGAIITILSFILNIANSYISSFYAIQLWNKATESLVDAGINYATYQDYFSWIFKNCYDYEIWLMLAPYIINLISWVIMFWCGFSANRSYYKHSIKKIKHIKLVKSNEDISNTIAVCGGVNTSIAWVIFVCYLILMFSTLFM